MRHAVYAMDANHAGVEQEMKATLKLSRQLPFIAFMLKMLKIVIPEFKKKVETRLHDIIRKRLKKR